MTDTNKIDRPMLVRVQLVLRLSIIEIDSDFVSWAVAKVSPEILVVTGGLVIRLTTIKTALETRNRKMAKCKKLVSAIN